MSGETDYFLEVAAGNRPNGCYLIHKYGHNASVGTSPVPVSHGGIYRTPQVSGATQLRVKAGNANDTAAGTGARSVYLEGLDSEGNLINEVIPTAGTSAGAASTKSFLRLIRASVYKSGSYASQTAGSHAADIVIENSAGTQNWATIDYDSAAGYADGHTEIGAYSVPKGKDAYLLDVNFNADISGSKTTTLYFYKRENILETSAPYTPIIKEFGISSAGEQNSFKFREPLRFKELTDIGFLAYVSSTTGIASVEFTLLIRDTEE